MSFYVFKNGLHAAVNNGTAEEKNHKVLIFEKKLDEEGTLIEYVFDATVLCSIFDLFCLLL